MSTCAILALLALSQVPAISLTRDVITLADGKAIAMAPPTCVFSPTAERFEWSESGRFLLVHAITHESYSLTKPGVPRIRIELIDWRARKNTTLINVPAVYRYAGVRWVGDDHYLVSESWVLPSGPQRAQPAGRTTATLHRAGSQQTWKVYDSGEVTEGGVLDLSVHVAPKHGYAIIVNMYRPNQVDLIHVNYRTGKQTPLSSRMPPFLDDDGYLVERFYTDRKPSGQVRRFLADGTTEDRPEKPAREAAEVAPQIQLVPSSAQLKLGKKTEGLRGLWLMATHTSDFQFALATPDWQQAQLAPDQSALAYLTKGNVFVRELLTLDKGDFETLLEREEQQEAMSTAKQVATAIHIYLADSNDVFPGQEGFADTIMPYIKSRSMLDSFTYTFSKKSATEIAEPAATVIGYVQGRKGRAVAYADGHVKWIKNP